EPPYSEEVERADEADSRRGGRERTEYAATFGPVGSEDAEERRVPAASSLLLPRFHLAGCLRRNFLQSPVFSTRPRSLRGIVFNGSPRIAKELGLPAAHVPPGSGDVRLEGLAGVWAPVSVALWRSDHSKHLGGSALEEALVSRRAS